MVGAARRAGEKQLQRDAQLLPLIEAIKVEHPFWGYRRVWATLRYKNGLTVNLKRVARIMRQHGLAVRRPEVRAKRTPSGAKPRPSRPCQWWGIDMTKLMTAGGWVYVVLVVDWYSKKIVGHHAGYQSHGQEWLQALEMAVQEHFPHGVRGRGLSLMSDNGCQPTGKTFKNACALLGIEQAFTSYNNPKGNADTERAMRTLKEELLWLQEWSSLEHLASSLSSWVKEFNAAYLHSALGWRTPQSVHDEAKLLENSPLRAA